MHLGPSFGEEDVVGGSFIRMNDGVFLYALSIVTIALSLTIRLMVESTRGAILG